MDNETEFIYLNQGNWFELRNINTDKMFPFDIEMLKNEILEQINNRSDKLSFINITFHSKYPKSTIESIDFYLDKSKFSKIAQMISAETRHPIITFHGTSNLDAVKSILKNGYIIPDSNNSIKKTHGSAYGCGIYSSPFFEKAMYYTTPDKIKYVYVLINIVLLAKMKLIPPTGDQNIDQKPPINGCYNDQTNTRVVYGLDQLVSADSNRIFPVAVMKINIA